MPHHRYQHFLAQPQPWRRLDCNLTSMLVCLVPTSPPSLPSLLGVVEKRNIISLVEKKYIESSFGAAYVCQSLENDMQVLLRCSSTHKHIITLFTLYGLFHRHRYNSSCPNTGGPPASGVFAWNVLDIDNLSAMPSYLAPMNQAAPICQIVSHHDAAYNIAPR